MFEINDFDAVRISLASQEQIRSWSYGEVTKPETINYRTLKPERDGLFCERIFGPTKDFECYCGKYKRIRYKGVICDKCGVEVARAKVRRERMGHIELAAPVAHIWYTKNYLPLLLGLKKNELERVIYFISYLVVDPGETPLRELQILDEEEYQRYKNLYGEGSFQAGTGTEVILNILEEMKIERLKDKLKEELLQERSKGKRLKLIRRLQVVESSPGFAG